MDYVIIDSKNGQVWNPRTKQFESTFKPFMAYKMVRRRGGNVPSRHANDAHDRVAVQFMDSDERRVSLYLISALKKDGILGEKFAQVFGEA
jgi:hypothetical protein